jgi:hypothetical protein
MVIGFLIFYPNLNWLVLHGFPFLEWQHNIKGSGQLIQTGMGEFLLQQISLTGMACLLWLAGVLFYFCTAAGKPYRFLGWAFVITLAFFVAVHGKNYYPISSYAIVIAGGAVVVEQATSKASWRHFRAVLVTIILAGTALLAPMYIPILPIDSLLRYQKAIGLHPPSQETAMLSSPLSVFFVGQFGWESLTAKVAGVYHNLSTDEQRRTAIFTRTYAPAAAIDFFGKRYGLPNAISGHLGYFLWEPANSTADVIIFVGYSFQGIAPFCDRAEVGAEIYDRYSYPQEMNKPVVICRGLKTNLQTDNRFKLWY